MASTVPFRRVAVALALVAGAAFAQTPSPDTILISNSIAGVTRAEYDAELTKLPANMREGFPNNPRRVNDLLVRMLVQKSFAAQAKAAGIDAKPETQARIALETEKLLAQMMIESIEAAAAAEFDANIAKYEARAKELYTIDRASFETPEQVSATHILFDAKKHGSNEAKRLAAEARAKVVAGADMNALAREVSDDPSAKQNGGNLGFFSRREMDPVFAEAAFTLKKKGDVSEPVLSQFGWHVIRLDERKAPVAQPYEQARETIMAELRRRYVDEKRDERIGAIRRDPKTQVNRDAVDALTPKIDSDAVRRAVGAPSAAPGAPK
ncbi:MAG: peptidylprolyl isomerase [Burkholderiales bacterium]